MSATDLPAPPRGRWDAVIVGAGPAGSMAALETARAGRSVLVVDMRVFPRFKVCGCCVNGRALSLLERAGLSELTRELGGVPLDRMRLAAGGRHAELALPGGMAVSRERLDTALIRAAEAAGATFIPECRAEVHDVGDDACSLALHTGNTTTCVEARVVVAADGLGGRLLERAGGDAADPVPHSRIGAGCVVDGRTTDYARGAISMACGAEGYVGLVRREDGRLNVAAAFDPAAVQRHGGLGALAAHIVADAGFSPTDELEPARWRGTPELTRRPPSAATHRCLAVGDAAGYVEPFTGEGMAWALETGLAAGALIASSGGAFDEDTARTWNLPRRRISAASERRCRWIALALRRPRLVRAAVGILSATPGLATPVIRRLNRSPTSYVATERREAA